MNKAPALILIMGLPATGKTTLSKKVAEAFDLPLISRDEIKVQIMDSVGWGDREWSKKVGKASYSLQDYMIKHLAHSKASFIVESDFAPEFANEKFNRIHEAGYDIIQIICSASDDVIIKRFKERAAEEATHPSSTEGQQGLDDLHAALARGQRQPLDVPGKILHLDTTAINETSYSDVLQELRGLLSA